MASPAVVWFRDDLRLADNPALNAAIATDAPVLCFYILDDGSDGVRPLGGAPRWWLHGSLEALGESLGRIGAELLLFTGSTTETVQRIAADSHASAVFWNRRYGAAEIALDSGLKERLVARGVGVQSFNGALLHEPWEIKNLSAKPFQVFTPYSRAAMSRQIPTPIPAPRKIDGGIWPVPLRQLSTELAELKLEPAKPNWAAGFGKLWKRGEPAARRKLAAFLEDRLHGYTENRSRPGIEGSALLSPHLRHGEISPRQVWHAVNAARAETPALEGDGAKFLTELVWRDFCYQLLYQHRDLATAPHVSRFETMPWSSDGDALQAWHRGMTGYPIVDAGMRQLWQVGWMHNRVRMIAASFLTKHLLTDWRRGEEWFWDTLVDADPANNAFNWQWVAGSGPDSAPFHRIFNPVLQGEKFDPEGVYVRAFVPELSRLPNRFLHKPWEAPVADRTAAGIMLGKTYPKPVVDHATARERAMEAFRSTREPASSRTVAGLVGQATHRA